MSFSAIAAFVPASDCISRIISGKASSASRIFSKHSCYRMNVYFKIVAAMIRPCEASNVAHNSCACFVIDSPAPPVPSSVPSTYLDDVFGGWGLFKVPLLLRFRRFRRLISWRSFRISTTPAPHPLLANFQLYHSRGYIFQLRNLTIAWPRQDQHWCLFL